MAFKSPVAGGESGIEINPGHGKNEERLLTTFIYQKSGRGISETGISSFKHGIYRYPNVK